MKKMFVLMMIFVAGATMLPAQITREKADTLVLKYLQDEGVQYNLLYVNVNPPSVEGIAITTSNDETFKAKYPCWAYFLNESELSRCRYLFVNEDANLLEVIANGDFGQSDLSQWKSLNDVGVIEREENFARPVIFPNPVGDFLILPSSGERTLVEIHDLKGARLFSESLSGKGNHQLNVSFLSAGIYLVSVYGETRVVYKIVKN